MTDAEDFFALFKDELNDPSALSLEEIQRAMPRPGDTRASMTARNNSNNPKRLTSAECAAEYWRNEGELNHISEGYRWEDMTGGWSSGENDARLRDQTLERFATLPHSDEVTE